MSFARTSSPLPPEQSITTGGKLSETMAAQTNDDAVADLLRFFRSLSSEARRDYEGLARLDREYGEDVVRERRARAKEHES